MLQRFRQRFGTAGLIVAGLAVVLALGGTALAASGALTGKQKKEVEKIAKKYAGKPGAAGAAGTNGTNGAPGKDGANGTNGSPGAAGKGVLTATENPGGNCAEGGVSVEVEGSGTKKYICNGEEGLQGIPGQDGSPWTAGGTLPAGATETGDWAAQASAAGAEFGIFAPISFSVPLSNSMAPGGKLPVAQALFGEESAEPFKDNCPGTTFRPTAKPGYLCVYQAVRLNTTFAKIALVPAGEGGATSTGAIVEFGPNTSEEGKEPAIVSGTFAITGCDPALPVADPNKCP